MKKLIVAILVLLPLCFLLYNVSKQVFNPSSASVMEFGAKGDGSTDDTIAFQEAIDTVAASGGGDVYVPAGTYRLQPIYLKSKVNLIGEDRDSVMLKLSDDANDQKKSRLVNVSEVEQVEIRNINFDGNYESHKDGVERR